MTHWTTHPHNTLTSADGKYSLHLFPHPGHTPTDADIAGVLDQVLAALNGAETAAVQLDVLLTQLRISDSYATDDNLNAVPSVWQIQNSLLRDAANAATIALAKENA